jgi:dihydrofolate synthase/folylpolyglutamate synthase
MSEPRWRRYLRFWRHDSAADVDDELAFHFKQRVSQYEAAGLPRDDALAAARAQFGDVASVREGLVHVTLAGRFQVLPGRPVTVLDVAHNVQAARVLADSLGTMGFYPRTLGVFGMLADKDIEGVVRALAPRIDGWYVAPLPGPRGATAERLEAALLATGVAPGAIHRCPDIAHAYAAARDVAAEADRIAAFGSFLTVAAALAAARDWR